MRMRSKFKEAVRLMNILENLNIDVLLKRLEFSNDEELRFLEKKLTNMRTGQIGEERLAKVFENYQFPFCYQVLNGVSLNVEAGGKFQTDCLVITTNLIFLLESKNISGKLYFEKNPERLVRERENGQIDIYESPEVQVERNVILFKRWLDERNINIPVIGSAVFTSAVHPIIVKEPQRIPALFPKSVFVFIQKIWNEYQNRTKYLSIEGIERLSEQIRTESIKNRYNQFPVKLVWSNENKIRLINGVRCLKCGKIGMIRNYGYWVCSCGHKDKIAHIPTLQEWFMLNKETITNKECRDYLLIEDRHLIKRLLKNENILEFGNTKGTYYKWNW